jgi:hypothetical protein
MPQQQQQPQGEPMDMESAKALFGERYNPDLKAYTRQIQTSPQKVAALGKAYAALFEMDPPLDVDGGDEQLERLFNWYATEEQDALFFRVVESLEHLHEFMEGRNDYLDYLKVTNHGPEGTMEVGWQDKRVGRVVWDRWTQPVEDPVMAYVLVADQFDLAFTNARRNRMNEPSHRCTATTQSATRPTAPMQRRLARCSGKG